MARSLIRVGDQIDHGGTVVTGSPSSDHLGRPIARVGDHVVCQRHGATTIVTGDWTFFVDGAPVAREHDKTACGGTLLATQSTLFVESGGSAGSAASGTGATATGASVPVSLLDKTTVCEECLLAASQSGAPLLGR